jgi:hypothetical protein
MLRVSTIEAPPVDVPTKAPFLLVPDDERCDPRASGLTTAQAPRSRGTSLCDARRRARARNATRDHPF